MPEDITPHSIAAAAKILGQEWTEERLYTAIRRGHGPRARRISPHRIVILHRDLLEWLDGLENAYCPRLYGEPQMEFHVDVEDSEENSE